ncbi:MAG: anthranilate synthase component I [Tepidanaerobacteraceae bacterium]|jgi:anthranilate synthase component 1|nr:anthranilate synthase component I [Tepidanaerobacteraceae bacterium]
MIFPDKPVFESMKRGHVVPVVLKMNADEFTPIELFYNLDGCHKFLLESAECGKTWGRYSFLGANPYMTVKSCKDTVATVSKGVMKTEKGRVLDIVGNHLKRYGYDRLRGLFADLPAFTGGAVGYVGYDVIRLYEKLPDNNPDELHLPECFLMFYKEVIIYDHFYHNLYVVYNAVPDEEIEYEHIVERLHELKNTVLRKRDLHPLTAAKNKAPGFRATCSQDAFCDKVRRAIEYIRAGDIFQVVLSERLAAATEVEPFEAYRRLRALNPSPYLFYMDFGDFQIVGSSPESLVSVKGGIVTTNPIAGTMPRGKTPEEDERLKEKLLADEKERAEHAMLVDLGRNDVGKVSEFGSVKVQRFMEVDMYSHVMHIVSAVTGRLKQGKTCIDALLACLPAGTVSGAPKIRAMEIIDELEEERRGIYAGAVGYLGFAQNMDFCIAIRTIVFKGGTAYIQAGAGIVCDSAPEKEYREVLNKAAALKEVLR